MRRCPIPLYMEFGATSRFFGVSVGNMLDIINRISRQQARTVVAVQQKQYWHRGSLGSVGVIFVTVFGFRSFRSTHRVRGVVLGRPSIVGVEEYQMHDM